METVVFSMVYELFMLVFSSLLGLALMPEALKTSADREENIAAFFFAPLIGFSVFAGVSYLAGNIFPYNRLLVTVLYLLSAAIIILRRDRLFIVRDKAALVFILSLIAMTVYVILCCTPREIDGGIYFTESAFDHQRTAIIDSIALAGFPLRSMWIADGGQLVTNVNHCGLHTVMAQPVILFGMQSFRAGAGIEGLVIIIMMMTAGGLAYQLSGKKISWLFLILVFLIGAPGDTLIEYVSPFWKGLFSPERYYNGVGFDSLFGFWPLCDDVLWQPHCLYSASITLLLVYLYCIVLKESDRNRASHIAVIMGIMAGAAFVGNVYSGLMALFIFIVALVPIYAFCRSFREDFNASVKYQLLVVLFGLIVSAPFLYSLFSAQSTVNVTTLYGVLPPFDSAQGVFGILIAFLEFTLVTLTAKTGIPHILGIAAMVIPGVLPKERYTKISAFYFLVISVVIFFCRSSFYTNDLGWRVPFPVRLFCLCASAVLLAKCFCRLYAKRAAFAYALVALTTCLIFVFSDALVENVRPIRTEHPETHVAFAKAAEGWKDVRKYTDKTDFVLCNPVSFSEITYNPYTGTNNSYLFSYYAGRFSPMADLTMAKDIISDEDMPRYEELRQFVIDFFTGTPSGEDVRRVAEELKVKALLVTPEDALWENNAVLASCYELRSDTDGYKVFIALA